MMLDEDDWHIEFIIITTCHGKNKRIITKSSKIRQQFIGIKLMKLNKERAWCLNTKLIYMRVKG